MKLLLTVIMIVGLWMPTNSSPLSPSLPQAEGWNGGTVSVVDVAVLLTEANGLNTTITKVDIFEGGSLQLSLTGCGSNSCRYDLSSLAPGTYHVEVTANTGFFSGTIQL